MLRRLPRRLAYPVVGLVLALGAPLGLFLVQALAQGVFPSFPWLADEFSENRVVYLYLFVSTPIIFIVLGQALGQRQDSLASQSLTDPLTGLGNRRYMDGRLNEEVARSLRFGTPLTLLLIDVDHLKEINDQGGHEEGDRALRAVAEGIRRTIRRSDVGVRLAGDEFAVLAPGSSAEEALELAGRIGDSVRAEKAGCTVSIGLADLDSAEEKSARGILRESDRALYTAKETGRDRASLSPRAASNRPEPLPDGEPEPRRA